MSYLVLARKWRPKRFAELVGQEHVVRALSNALDSGRVHHAFLFTGTRGVGKTTIARIFAKSLNCETGTSADPCGTCPACLDIDAGRYIDLLEIDAASNTGVDDVREVIENAQYMPSRGKFKVYLIDEVHMLSKAAFNALLKTLEEPPEHVKFLLATTDPQKLPVTVLSRCLQFNLKRLDEDQIQGQMTRILAAEEIESDPSAIVQLSKAADGSLRDGLSLLDQAIAYAGGALREDVVRTMLGTVDRTQVVSLLEALAEGDVRFEGVRFAYPDRPAVIEALDLHIPAGQKVGIVGPSGAGKSTLIALIQRLDDVESGRVLIDGQDIRSVSQDSLRDRIAVVPQETALFNRSIADNIRYGREDADEAAIESAARRADALAADRGVPFKDVKRNKN